MNRTTYSSYSFIMAVRFFLSGVANPFSQTAVEPSGSGASGDPYLITILNNLAGLQKTANDTAWGIYYKQTANVDGSPTSNWNSGKNISPLQAIGLLSSTLDFLAGLNISG